jgi:hypothetical protein
MLTADQIHRYRDDGFLPLPGLFAFDEVAWLRDEAQSLVLRRSRGEAGQAWVEEAPDGTIYGAHLDESPFAKLAAHPRILGAVRQLLDEPVYIHQTRLLPWRANGPGDVLWRRDFATWSALDGLPAGRALTAAVLLDDEAYGPALQMVPGSHRSASRGAPRLAGVGGGLGTVVLYDANVTYGFGRAGERPYSRLYLISFNAVANAPAAPRGEPYAASVAEPPYAEADDCLWPAPWCAAG